MIKEVNEYIGQNEETCKVLEIWEEGVCVGGASISIYDEGTLIDRIDIYPEYRNKGYGSQALKELAWEYVCYIAPDNEDAARLYSRLGEETYENGWYGFDCGFGVFRL